MNTLTSLYLPFAPISWWAFAQNASEILFDTEEPFRKMSLRNRYFIAGANGVIRLSVPIRHGRDQKLPMKDVKISNTERWQTQHWRAITAAYRRTPFFGFYEPELYPIFQKQYDWLIDFNLDSLLWIKDRLKWKQDFHMGGHIVSSPSNSTDLRTAAPTNSDRPFPEYDQIFADRIGFVPDLSILDLFFAEGPAAHLWIKKNNEMLLPHFSTVQNPVSQRN